VRCSTWTAEGGTGLSGCKRAGGSTRESEPAAEGENKADRGDEHADKGHNPMVPEQERNWSSDVSANSSMIATQICNNEVGPRTSQEVRSARQGWDQQTTRLNPGTATA